MIHRGCGGTVEWVDVDDLDEAWVCQRCGQEVDGEDMDPQTPALPSTQREDT